MNLPLLFQTEYLLFIDHFWNRLRKNSFLILKRILIHHRQSRKQHHLVPR
jgi:hypothetical protein